MTRRRVAVVLSVLALVLSVVAILLATGHLFGRSISERVSSEVDATARCRKAGLQNLAGERETVYTCTYREPTLKDSPIVSRCYAIVDGDVYAVSADPC